MIRYWGNLKKCTLWLLLPSPRVHLEQLLVASLFIDLMALHLIYNDFAGYIWESPSPSLLPILDDGVQG